ncbi:MAG: pseudouridine synthase, partial [Clostridia bacterium]|nr:pseudouridine synthase [Clostridia bacterium]
MMDSDYVLHVDQDEGLRLDIYLAKYIEDYSRSYIQKTIKDGNVTVNGKIKNPSYKVNSKDSIMVTISSNNPSSIEPEDIPLDIVYEDDDIIVVNKSRGMVVHPAIGNYSSTLVNALMYHTKNSLSDINGIERPGIVHRIDKDTSGVIVVAKNNSSHRFLADIFSRHDIKREYIAIVKGYPDSEKGKIDAP